jgi:hypothetical protein
VSFYQNLKLDPEINGSFINDMRSLKSGAPVNSQDSSMSLRIAISEITLERDMFPRILSEIQMF